MLRQQKFMKSYNKINNSPPRRKNWAALGPFFIFFRGLQMSLPSLKFHSELTPENCWKMIVFFLLGEAWLAWFEV